VGSGCVGERAGRETRVHTPPSGGPPLGALGEPIIRPREGWHGSAPAADVRPRALPGPQGLAHPPRALVGRAVCGRACGETSRPQASAQDRTAHMQNLILEAVASEAQAIDDASLPDVVEMEATVDIWDCSSDHWPVSEECVSSHLDSRRSSSASHGIARLVSEARHQATDFVYIADAGSTCNLELICNRILVGLWIPGTW
jgi:hypothetical protein